MWILKLATSKVGQAVGALLFVLGTIFVVFKAGERNQKKGRQVQDNKDYITTRESIDEAVKDSPTDANSALKWLRNRNKK